MKARCKGFTLLELITAMLLTVLLGVGLFELGWKARRWSEHARIATEARGVAKQKLEEMIGVGREGLAQPGCLLLGTTTYTGSLGRRFICRPRLIWHAEDGSVCDVSSNRYAELHLDVVFPSPLLKTSVTNSFPMILD